MRERKGDRNGYTEIGKKGDECIKKKLIRSPLCVLGLFENTARYFRYFGGCVIRILTVMRYAVMAIVGQIYPKSPILLPPRADGGPEKR